MDGINLPQSPLFVNEKTKIHEYPIDFGINFHLFQVFYHTRKRQSMEMDCRLIWMGFFVGGVLEENFLQEENARESKEIDELVSFNYGRRQREE